MNHGGWLLCDCGAFLFLSLSRSSHPYAKSEWETRGTGGAPGQEPLPAASE